jgi:hypothetical protein
MSEEPLTRAVLASVLAEFHMKVISPAVARVVERLAGIEFRLFELEGRRHRVPRRVDEVLDRVDELALRFEGTESRLEQLAEEILDLSARAGRVVEGRSPTSH